EASIAGATWVITANPLRPEADRAHTFFRQLSELTALLEEEGTARVVGDARQFEQARAEGKHAAFIGVQGANALPLDLEFLTQIAPQVLRITLMHMSDSAFGHTSAPGLRRADVGLTPRGFTLVEAMNALRIGVDLAHIHPRGFWDAVRVHRSDLPLLVTHTGVSGVHRHWRNLDDAQLRAVAKSGGVVGIMYHALYMGDPLLRGRVATVARHIQHAVQVMGDDHVALGSDWDGLICTPRDMPTCLELPRLVEALLQLKLPEISIRKILGRSFLRVVKLLRDSS
ncbi:MAG TPA: membrane dipeptidase, partial [Polyangiaceae bacterium]|nr:membrane dipeptidase [Polyangiaceae bacterium]